MTRQQSDGLNKEIREYLVEHHGDIRRDTISIWSLISDRGWSVSSHQILAALKRLDEDESLDSSND